MRLLRALRRSPAARRAARWTSPGPRASGRCLSSSPSPRAPSSAPSCSGADRGTARRADGGGDAAVNHSIFALEVCARLVPESPLRAALSDLIRSAPERLSLHQKWMQYQRAGQLIVESLHLCEKGCWDFFDDDARARRDYDM